MSIFYVYMIVTVSVVAVDFFLSFRAMAHGHAIGRNMSRTFLFAGVVSLTYLTAVLMNTYFIYSVFSSLYFIAIDYMLLFLVSTLRSFTEDSPEPKHTPLLGLANLWALVETVFFAINPFSEIVISYQLKSGPLFSWYDYQMKPLYIIHLCFSYILVGVGLLMLIIRMCKVPKEYRQPYLIIIAGIGLVVAINALYLFLPDDSVLARLDYSICAYSLATLVIYWCCFRYVPKVMPGRFKNYIFESINQGIVLFDFRGNRILLNDRAGKLLSEEALSQTYHAMPHFLHTCNINIRTDEDFSSCRCFAHHSGTDLPLRCDYRRLKNKHDRILGYLYVFTDESSEMDLLTGFRSWDSYLRMYRDGKEPSFAHQSSIAVCEINNFAGINTLQGHEAGDKAILTLAELLRRNFPAQTGQVRGPEATLILICPECSEQQTTSLLEKTAAAYSGDIQYAVTHTDREHPDTFEAIQTAIRGVRNKQMLDRQSDRSQSLSGLICALQECDADTEAHVQRTRRTGIALGKRLELSDVELSNLNLLCLLHDIGKIGIPLDILNKPGKLSAQEWQLIQTHVNKGYEIALSNREISPIAEMILHHHERWDGQGYPDHLAGDNIPILSRVIAVVDAYDAMTNNRSYRIAMTSEKAEAELKRCAGSQFDPCVVSQFLQLLEENPEEFISQNTAENTAAAIPAPASLDSPAQLSPGSERNAVLLNYARYTLDNRMCIITADAAFTEITGYTQDDLAARKFAQQDLLPPEDREQYLSITAQQLQQDARAFVRHRIRCKDGQIIQVLCYGRQYYNSANRQEQAEIIISRI